MSYVTYNGIFGKEHGNDKSIVEKFLELQQWILDHSTVPYEKQEHNDRLVTRSASSAANTTTSNVQMQIDLQRKVLEGYTL
jgi:hypothetical protein